MAGKQLLSMPLRDLADGLRSRDMTAESLVEASIEASKDCDNRAYISWRPEPALELARAADQVRAAGGSTGPLMGIPVSVKDMFGVSGFPTYAGCARALPKSWEAEGPLVRALQSQLAPVVGKTHCVEFAFGGLGTNAHWPTPQNPWCKNEHRVPGGSSSGAGVSLINGTAALALGTDTAGSVRVPAAMTGVAGLKTTGRRWSTRGIVPLSSTLDTPGLLARRVEDLAFAFEALDPMLARRGAGIPASPDLSHLTLGVPDGFFWENCSPGIAETVEASLKQLEAAGARLVKFELSGLATVHSMFLKGGVAAPELAALIREELPDYRSSLDPDVAARLHKAEGLPAWEYIQRRTLIDRLSAQAAEELSTVDALLTPTVTLTPPTVSSLADPDAYVAANMQVLRNTAVANYLGLCGLSLPVGFDSMGLPVGLQLLMGPWREERLLAVGQAVERCLGTGPDIMGLAPAD